MDDKKQICADCGSREAPVLVNRGYGWMELLMWFCLVLPGLIYSAWRRTRRHWVCSFCGNPSMVSIYSARARSMMALMGSKEVSKAWFKKPLGDTKLKPRKSRPPRKKKTPPRRPLK